MSAWMAVQLCSLGLSSVSRDENSTQANPFHDGDNFSHRDEQIHMRQPTDKLLSGRPIGRLPSAQIPTALIGSVQALAPAGGFGLPNRSSKGAADPVHFAVHYRQISRSDLHK